MSTLSMNPLMIPSILTAIPLAMTLCAICRSADLVIPCQTCHRAQCQDCFSTEEDAIRSCKGCRMERELNMDQELDFDPTLEMVLNEEEEQEEEKEQPVTPQAPPPPPTAQLHLGNMYHPAHVNFRPYEYVEHGTMIFRPIQYPTYDEWKYAEQVLMSQIMFCTSDSGIQSPKVGKMYLVGRVYYSSPTSITTDYMLSYEHDPANPHEYVWVKYMSTYFNQSPMPHDENMFYPYALPIIFRRPHPQYDEVCYSSTA